MYDRSQNKVQVLVFYWKLLFQTIFVRWRQSVYGYLRPYSCRLRCGERFWNRTTRNSHEKTICKLRTDKDLYQCQFCGLKMLWPSAHIQHEKKYCKSRPGAQNYNIMKNNNLPHYNLFHPHYNNKMHVMYNLFENINLISSYEQNKKKINKHISMNNMT